MPKSPTTKRHAGGAPPKVPGGLHQVLFVRVDEPLMVALDAYVKSEEGKVTGRRLTRADAVRELLHVALALT